VTTKIILYIGADNSTHKVTDEYMAKVEQILSKYWKGFTLTKHKGYYEGYIEESLSAVIFVLQLVFKDLENCVNELKVKLVQDSIGVEIEANVDFTLK
jgi:hypothetical protein